MFDMVPWEEPVGPWGGALALKSGTWMCHRHDPHFSGQSALPSLPIYHQCTAHIPLPFSIFKKICHFQPCFWLKFQLSRCKLLFPRPHTTHTHTHQNNKKMLVAPSGTVGGGKCWTGTQMYIQFGLSYCYTAFAIWIISVAF